MTKVTRVRSQSSKHFDYNFDICVICQSPMQSKEVGGVKATCPKGCTIYNFDPQSELVQIQFVEKEVLTLRMHEKAGRKEPHIVSMLNNEMQKFLTLLEKYKSNQ